MERKNNFYLLHEGSFLIFKNSKIGTGIERHIGTCMWAVEMSILLWNHFLTRKPILVMAFLVSTF